MLLKCKRKREEPLLNSNASSTHERITATYEEICNAEQQFILLIYGSIHGHLSKQLNT